MIATIICVPLLVIGIVLLVIVLAKGEQDIAALPLFGMTISSATLLVSLLLGYVVGGKPTSMEREDIIENFKRCPCGYHYEQIKSWNEKLEKGNNYWCRFKLKDTDVYTIRDYEVFEIKVVE